jgi:hypothetical protein
VTRTDFVAKLLDSAKMDLRAYWDELPPERGMRLDGIEAELHALKKEWLRGQWEQVLGILEQRAEETASKCSCGRLCSRDKKSIDVVVLEQTMAVSVTYYYCRYCRRGQAPVRQWLGIHDGSHSGGFARALVALCLLRSFGEGAEQMKEQHGQDVDRTRAERVTYQVGLEAQRYLEERRENEVARMRDAIGLVPGIELLEFTADGGGVPVGTLVRPPKEEATQFTKKRKLPKGRREQSKREVRLISVHRHQVRTERVVDLHVAPLNQPEVSGARMYAAALSAGLGDNTRVHGVFDMGTWIRTQFHEQFPKDKHSACADIFHVDEYLAGAAQTLFPRDENLRKDWLSSMHLWLKESQSEQVLQQLHAHSCRSGCPKDDHGDCRVLVAQRYLEHFQPYMDYARFLAEGLPIGSGEAEGGIRHLVRRRLDVPGAWREENVGLLCALLSIKASGWWEDFWRWLDEQDQLRFRLRRAGTLQPTTFRGAPRARRQPVAQVA